MEAIKIIDGIILRADAATEAAEESQVVTDLKENFLRLFPSWQVILTTLIVIVLLFFILRKYAWGPVTQMYQKRRDYIQKNIDSAEQSVKEAEKDREEAKTNLANSRSQAEEIISKAKEEAEAIMIKEVADAKAVAEKLVEDAKGQIAADMQRFEEEKRVAIIDVAMKAASKVVEENLDENTSKKIIEEFID